MPYRDEFLAITVLQRPKHDSDGPAYCVQTRVGVKSGTDVFHKCGIAAVVEIDHAPWVKTLFSQNARRLGEALIRAADEAERLKGLPYSSFDQHGLRPGALTEPDSALPYESEARDAADGS